MISHFHFLKSSQIFINLLISTQQLTMDDILNNSYFNKVQKQKYSFSKEKRFPDLKPKYTIDFYDQSSIKKQRSAAFGYGSKYDFFQQPTKKKIPSPFDYEVNSGRLTRGLSFGLGRNDIKANSYIDPEKLKNPNAGKYQIDHDVKIKKRAPSCVIVSKHPQDSFIKHNDNPDPAKYNPVDTIYSRRKRSAQFGFGSSKRFNYDNNSSNKMIGPSSYNYSPREAAKNGAISHAARKTYAIEAIQKSIGPGPKYYIP